MLSASNSAWQKATTLLKFCLLVFQVFMGASDATAGCNPSKHINITVVNWCLEYTKSGRQLPKYLLPWWNVGSRKSDV